MSRSIGSRLAGAFAFLASACLAVPALACWDGMAAHGDRVDVSVPRDGSWRPDTARHMAIWITRLDALVPEGTTISIFGSSMMCDGPACPASTTTWPTIESSDMASAFDAAAKLFVVAPAARARAASLTSSVYTVQVYAGARGGAFAHRDRIQRLSDEGDIDVAGFYVEGGFPGVQKTAHILDDGGTYRVVVGAHRSLASAKEAAVQLTASGVTAFVRTMPPGRSFDEYVSSAGGE